MKTTELYPLKLKPVYKDKIWGGRNLERLLRKVLPDGVSVGESWEIGDDSVVVNGTLAGRRLGELVKTYGSSLLGIRAANSNDFPLLIKFIDAHDRLSVQVHPDDDQARRMERVGRGKTEMWYVLDAAPGAEIIHGLDCELVKPSDLERMVLEGGLLSCLHRLPIAAGDSIFIPAGTVHAMGEGLVICEVQQNCDITYRLYDWDRLTSEGQPRELHVAKAASVTRPGPRQHKMAPLVLQESFGRRSILSACQYFVVELLDVERSTIGNASGRSFVSTMALEGQVEIVSRGVVTGLIQGDCAVIPADCGEYELRPATRCRIMTAYVPDLLNDLVKPLLESGLSREEIAQLGGDPASNDLLRYLQ